MRILGVIPARGGSKGVPRKNIREVAGYPLIAWTISVAQEAGIEMSAKEVATLGENLSSLAAVVLGLLTIWTRKKADKRIE